jgi:hypothetical protein
MAKHVSTTSSRSTASAKSTPSKIRVTGAGVAALQATLSASLAALDKRTVTHAAAFQALDLIDQAIGDVTATSGVLDEIIVYCPSCYRERGPIELADERLRGRLFVGTRFVCSATRSYDSAVAPRPCGSLGHIIIRPPARDRIPPGRSIPWCSISCPRCVPCWEISQVRLDRPPRSGSRQHCRCPGRVQWHIRGRHGGWLGLRRVHDDGVIQRGLRHC